MSDLDTRLLPSLLLSLPTELLARIVELVHLQDVAFRSRVARLEDLDDADVGLWKQEWGGKTLAQLALVSKLFHALAVPHQFEVCPVSVVGGNGRQLTQSYLAVVCDLACT